MSALVVADHCTDKICQHRHNFCTKTLYKVSQALLLLARVTLLSAWDQSEGHTMFKPSTQPRDVIKAIDFENLPLLGALLFSWMVTGHINGPIYPNINAIFFKYFITCKKETSRSHFTKYFQLEGNFIWDFFPPSPIKMESILPLWLLPGFIQVLEISSHKVKRKWKIFNQGWIYLVWH